MELSHDDLELINALQIAPRATWGDLGRILRRHPSTLSQRWARLSGQRLAWTVGHLGGRPEAHCTALIDIEAAPDRLDAVRGQLCAMVEVQSVDGATRRADFRLTCLSRDWLTMKQQVLPRISAIAGVQRVHVSLCTRIYASGEHLKLDVLGPSQEQELAKLAPRPVVVPTLIPESLWPCLRVLQANGRATVREIARETGTHPSTAARLLQQALQRGMVMVRCEVAADYSGSPMLVQWCAKVPPGQQERVAHYLRNYRSLRLCAVTSGEANMTFVMQLRNPTDIIRIEHGLVEHVPQIQILESSVGVQSYKRMGWLLEADGRTTGRVVL